MTWVIKKKGVIVCADLIAFEEIRAKFFPDIPAEKWAVETSWERNDALPVQQYTNKQKVKWN